MIIDHSIPYKNLLFRCDAYVPAAIHLPDGYCFREYRDGDAAAWAQLEYAIHDFDTLDEAYRYFCDTYFGEREALRQRFLCVVNPAGSMAGCVIAWRELSNGAVIPAVHWLVVSPDAQGMGIGRALMQKLLERFLELDAFPVYLHSQPCSYVAIGLYSSLGFRLLKRQTIMNYENQYPEAVEVLRPLMPPQKYEKLLREAIE